MPFTPLNIDKRLRQRILDGIKIHIPKMFFSPLYLNQLNYFHLTLGLVYMLLFGRIFACEVEKARLVIAHSVMVESLLLLMVIDHG